MLHNYYAVCFEGVIQALDTFLNIYIMNCCYNLNKLTMAYLFLLLLQSNNVSCRFIITCCKTAAAKARDVF